MEYQDVAAVRGEALGTEGVGQLVERAETVCAWERTRIELTNESELIAKKAEYATALEEERSLKARLVLISPLPDGKSRGRRIVISWIVATVLVISGFALSLMTLEPYRQGMKAVFYCLGIAVVVPFLVEKALELFASETLKKVMLGVACLAGLASMILLATIRGNLLGQQVREESASAEIEGEEPRNNASQNTFYEDTVPLLQLVMALLAVAMELGAGIAVHEAERMNGTSDGEYESLRQQLREAQERLSHLAQEIVGLQNEAQIFVARFWRDFYWSMLKGTLRSVAKQFVLPTLTLMVLCPHARCTQLSVDLVIAVDLTKSVDRVGPDGQKGFAKNIAAVTQLLGSLPAGAHVTIFGITANSFAQPYILLQAKLNSDPGYFGEKLASGRREIVRVWMKRSARLRPRFRRTDILGALVLASALFAEQPETQKKILVISSDMRQDTPDLTLDSKRGLHSSTALGTVQQRNLVTDLRGIDVYVLGADATGERIARWQELRTFWEEYFRRARAHLKAYSVFREERVPWP